MWVGDRPYNWEICCVCYMSDHSPYRLVITLPCPNAQFPAVSALDPVCTQRTSSLCSVVNGIIRETDAELGLRNGK